MFQTHITLTVHNSKQEKLIQLLNLENTVFKRDIKLLINNISTIEKTSQSKIDTLELEKKCLQKELDDTKSECDHLRVEIVNCHQDDERKLFLFLWGNKKFCIDFLIINLIHILNKLLM